ncbi:MAG: sigma-70 family RNA polymerase sigma factor [Candidatus Krumholzibacteriia bacterium]
MQERAGTEVSGWSDDELVAAVAQGDEAAMRTLVERWERPLLGLLRHLLGSVEDAEDLAQETFVRVFEQARDYRAQGLFRSWLFRIAANLARSGLRRRRIVRWVTFEPLRHDRPAPGRTAEDELAAAEERERLHRALARLPWRQREAVVLKRFQGLSYGEIAGILGTTVPGVESLLQRAATGLRAHLEREGGGS